MGLLAATAKNNVDTVLKNEKIQTYKINDGHPLIGCDEYVRGLYIDMLCVVAMYENEDNENQNRFIQRIMAGCNEKTPINEHIKNAMQLSVEKISEIIKQIKDNNLENIFYLESLIINCANGQPNKKQAHFLAELGEVLGFEKTSIEFICKLAVSIIEQSFEKIKALVEKYVNIDDYIESAMIYIDPIINKNIISDNMNLYLYSLLLSDKPINIKPTVIEDFLGKRNIYEIKNYNSVTIENQFINKALVFTSVHTVIIKNCNISALHEYGVGALMKFKGVEKISIIGCNFHNIIDMSVFNFEDKGIMIEVSDSIFQDIKNRTSHSVIFGDGHENKLILSGCTFRNIYNGYGRYSGVIAHYFHTKSQNCIFSNCSGGDVLFYTNDNLYGSLSDNNNTYTGCDRKTR